MLAGFAVGNLGTPECRAKGYFFDALLRGPGNRPQESPVFGASHITELPYGVLEVE
jgi:hypothetical protein